MKFLDNLEKMFARLNRLGIFFGACTAGFKAAHDYVQQRTKAIELKNEKTENDVHVTSNH